MSQFSGSFRHWYKAVLLLFWIPFSLALLPSHALAAVLNVPSADYPTIQSAITAAASGDTILVAPGVYTGAGNTNLTSDGKSFTLQSTAGADQTIIDGEGAAQGLQFQYGTLTVRGFTFRNCFVYSGGAIRSAASTTLLVNCAFLGNRADNSGGAVEVDDIGGGATRSSRLDVTNCTFVGNVAGFQGGAIHFQSGVGSLTNCTIVGNQNPGNNRGGVSVAYQPVDINNSILWDNQGQIFAYETTVTVRNSDVEGNPGTPSNLDANGNFSADPLFVRNPSAGPDGTWGTADDDYGDLHLGAPSPCINAGDNALLPADTLDLDGDGDTTETLPVDLDQNRRINDSVVDLGVYEVFNTAPDANAGSSRTVVTTGTSASVTLSGSASVDPNGDALSYQWNEGSTLLGSGENLSVSLPLGVHTITLTVTDPYGAQDTDTVTITVIGAPTANAQGLSVPFNTPTGITLTGSDPNSPPRALTYTIVTSPSHGTLSGTAPNLTYTPAAGYQGSDRFTFKVSNGVADSAIATVSITVAAGVPTASSQSVSTGANTATAVTLTGSDPDVPALPLTYAVATGPSHGTLSGTAPNLIYTPAAGYVGSDRFTFTVSNGFNTSAAATVSITVTDTIAPSVTATADKTTLFPPNGKSVPVTVTGTVTDSGSGVNLSSGSYTVSDSQGTSIPSGTFTINADGSYSFTLPLIASRKGTSQDDRVYTITITAKDNAGNTGSTTVTVTVPHDRGK